MRTLFIILTFVIGCTILSCQKDQQQYISTHKNQILSVSSETDSVIADGSSIVKITARINSSTNSADLKTVTFTAAKGSFEENGQAIYAAEAKLTNGQLLAVAYLRSGRETIDKAGVKVSVPKVDTTLFFRYITARPDSIKSESIVAQIANNYEAEVPLSTYLLRKKGQVSLRQQANYKAFKADGSEVGRFRGIAPSGSDSSGIVRAVFVLRDSVYSGSLRIITSITGSQRLLTDTVYVDIKKK